MRKLTLIFLIVFSIKSVTVSAQVDPKAAAIANEVMVAMGGEKTWNTTRHLHWNFFGARTLTWNKYTGDVRIDIPKDSTVYLVNINTLTGKATTKGKEITDEAELKKVLAKAKSIWINDSYWLTMPFKLQDPGVTLTYVGKGKTETGATSDILGLTFDSVGDTPQNKYLVYVDTQSRLVTQWSYFAKATDEKPRFTLPWEDYKAYGKLMLSGERGERDLTDILVFKKLPASVYTSFETPIFK